MPALTVGEPAPDFTARNLLTHARVSLGDEQGKLVFLTFWASWWPPCRKEIPILEAVQRKLGTERAVVLAVSFNEHDESLVRQWARDGTWHITLLEDYGARIARQYGIEGIPRLFIIGADGRILKVHAGFGPGYIEALVADINAALQASGQGAIATSPVQ